MTICELRKTLNLSAFVTGTEQAEVTGAYFGDLLSRVMVRLNKGNVWVTIHGHVNIVAVAVYAEVSGIIIAEDEKPSSDAVLKAGEEGITILSSPKSAYEIAKELARAGI